MLNSRTMNQSVGNQEFNWKIEIKMARFLK